MADKYIDVEITYSDEDEQKYFEAFACFISQFTSEEIKESIDKQKNDNTNFKVFQSEDPTRYFFDSYEILSSLFLKYYISIFIKVNRSE